jgi:hypothetical protein
MLADDLGVVIVETGPCAARIASHVLAMAKSAAKKSGPARKSPNGAKKTVKLQSVGRRAAGRSDDAHAFIPDPSEGGKPPSDDLAELLGEDFLQAATSGNEVLEDDLDSALPEEIGGPFVTTTAREELAHDVDESNPRDAKREPFPKTSAAFAQGSADDLLDQERDAELDGEDDEEEQP